MQVTKAQVEAVLKTLPIGYYLGRKASVKLDENAATSYAAIIEDALVISLKNVNDAAAAIPESAEKYWDIERLTRCILYHEVGHLIYTSERLMNARPYRFKNGLTHEKLRLGLNTIEDERIERRLQPAVLGVDFPRFVKLVNGYAPDATPRLPKKASPQQRLYAAVRYGVGSDADLKAVADFWAEVEKLQVVLNNSELLEVSPLANLMVKLVYHFYKNRQQTQELEKSQSTVEGKKDEAQDQPPQDGNGGRSCDGQEQQETDDGEDGGDGESGENESEKNDQAEKGGESDGEGEDGEDGDGEGESGDDGSEAETEESNDSGDCGGGENGVGDGEEGEGDANGEGEPTEDESMGNGGRHGGKSPTEREKAIERLRQDMAKGIDWHELPEESPVKKALTRLLKRYRTRAGSCRGEREEYATGRVSARAVALNEDRLFRDRGHGSGSASQKIALTIWVDCSGSFCQSVEKINKILKAVRRAERESAGSLVVDVVAVGECLYYNYFNEETTTFMGPSRDAVVLKKTTQIQSCGCNTLSLDYALCHKKTRRPGTRQFDLVVFDGECTGGISNYFGLDGTQDVFGDAFRNRDWDRVSAICQSLKPTEGDAKKAFGETELEAAKCWNSPRTSIISDWSNSPLFNFACPTAKKQYLTGGYAEQLEEAVAEMLERL